MLNFCRTVSGILGSVIAFASMTAPPPGPPEPEPPPPPPLPEPESVASAFLDEKIPPNFLWGIFFCCCCGLESLLLLNNTMRWSLRSIDYLSFIFLLCCVFVVFWWWSLMVVSLSLFGWICGWCFSSPLFLSFFLSFLYWRSECLIEWKTRLASFSLTLYLCVLLCGTTTTTTTTRREEGEQLQNNIFGEKPPNMTHSNELEDNELKRKKMKYQHRHHHHHHRQHDSRVSLSFVWRSRTNMLTLNISLYNNNNHHHHFRRRLNGSSAGIIVRSTVVVVVVVWRNFIAFQREEKSVQ